MTIEIPKNLPIQPVLNLGIVGHVDHGKTTLTKLLSGKWTDTHSLEKKRGITIKLGYTNFTIHYDEKTNIFSVKEGSPVKKVSIVDAPGHESFMGTMISGAAVMDAAILVITADQPCPQPQTIEHLKALDIAGIKDIIVIQNKIDLVSKEEAIEHFHQVKKFLKGTIAENAPILPLSAQHSVNISPLLEKVYELKNRKIDRSEKPLMNIVRSFDINKPGMDIEEVNGGVLGGAITSGEFKVGDEIEIKPGLPIQKEGKQVLRTINAKIKGLKSDKDSLEKATIGGSVAIITDLDPIMTHKDALVGQMAGPVGSLPEALMQVTFEPKLFDKVVTSEGDLDVKDIILGEPLMMIVNSMTTVGVASKANPREVTVNLKRAVMGFKDDRVVIFKRFAGNKWRIAGYGVLKL
ncbi:MAG: translation initiation factor IF-2 subunit gamma [Nanoarchaeota archaeon]